jgi:hypothetical protein
LELLGSPCQWRAAFKNAYEEKTMSDEIERLLTQIRDLQVEHLAEYRRVTEKSTALQELAIKRQQLVVKRGMIVLVLLIPSRIVALVVMLKSL